MPSTAPIYENQPGSQAALLSGSRWWTRGNVIHLSQFEAGVAPIVPRPVDAFEELAAASAPEANSMIEISIPNERTDMSADSAYVLVSTVTKSISAFVFLICMFSLVVSLSTEFSIINRFVSVIAAFMAGGFYVIGTMLEKQNGGPSASRTRKGHRAGT